MPTFTRFDWFLLALWLLVASGLTDVRCAFPDRALGASVSQVPDPSHPAQVSRASNVTLISATRAVLRP